MQEQFYNKLNWPYTIKIDEEKQVNTDVLILGGGIAGCWAAIAVARKGLKATIVEKARQSGVEQGDQVVIIGNPQRLIHVHMSHLRNLRWQW